MRCTASVMSLYYYYYYYYYLHHHYWKNLIRTDATLTNTILCATVYSLQSTVYRHSTITLHNHCSLSHNATYAIKAVAQPSCSSAAHKTLLWGKFVLSHINLGHCTSVCGATVVPPWQVSTHIRLLLWTAEN
jgi:hypothetical protein